MEKTMMLKIATIKTLWSTSRNFWSICGQYGEKKGLENFKKSSNPLIYKARPAGFEPATYGFVVQEKIADIDLVII